MSPLARFRFGSLASLLLAAMLATTGSVLVGPAHAQNLKHCELLKAVLAEGPTGFRKLRGPEMGERESGDRARQWSCKGVDTQKCEINDQIGLRQVVHTPIFLEIEDRQVAPRQLINELSRCNLTLLEYDDRTHRMVEVRDGAGTIRRLAEPDGLQMEVRAGKGEAVAAIAYYFDQKQRGYMLRVGISDP